MKTSRGVTNLLDRRSSKNKCIYILQTPFFCLDSNFLIIDVKMHVKQSKECNHVYFEILLQSLEQKEGNSLTKRSNETDQCFVWYNKNIPKIIMEFGQSRLLQEANLKTTFWVVFCVKFTLNRAKYPLCEMICAVSIITCLANANLFTPGSTLQYVSHKHWLTRITNYIKLSLMLVVQ